MRRGVGVPLVVAAFVAASCSGGSDAAPESTGATASTTDVPVPATSDPVDTTEVTTTDAPTTTIDPTDELIAEIEADLNAGEQALLAAGAAPSDPELRQQLESYFSGTALVRLISFLDGLVVDGLFVRPHPEVESINVVTEVGGQADPDSVEVTVCRIDAGVVFDVLPGGGEAIVNDSVIRYDTRIVLRRVDGTWMSEGDGESLAVHEGVAECDV